MSLANFIYRIDSLCREDLSKLVLVSERDYVTQFTCLLRYMVSNYSVYGQTLPGAIEQSIGCDAVLVLKFNSGYKIGFFEAKYPRYKNTNPYVQYRHWDSDNRFNRQLRDQNLFKICFPQVVIWNLFFDNSQIGQINSPFIDSLGSSLVLIEDIVGDISNHKWNKKKLIHRLSISGINIRELIERMSNCTLGTLVEKKDGVLNLEATESWKGSDSISIPVWNSENSSSIRQSLKQLGLKKYLYVEIE